MNCSFEENNFNNSEQQNVKSKLYVPGVGMYKLDNLFYFLKIKTAKFDALSC